MDLPHILSFAFGTVFLAALLVLAIVIMLRERPVPSEAMFIFRVVLALAAGGFGAVLPGLISLQVGAGTQLGLQAGGALALTALVYLSNPPTIVGNIIKPQPGKIRKHRRRNIQPPSAEGPEA